MTPARPRRSLEEMLGPAPRKAGRPIDPARTEKVKADTELVRVKIAEKRGLLVEKAAERKEARAVFTAVRQRLLAVPARVQAAKPHDRGLEAAYEAEIRAAMLDISRWAGV